MASITKCTYRKVSASGQRKTSSSRCSLLWQTIHFHCSLLEPPNPYKYIYHLSDNTTHDPSVVDTVLDDIFVLQKIRNEAVLIKTDNAPTQYKNKYAFGSYQRLADNFNCTIVKAYGAAGHGKGLVDAMSAFGVKSILRRAIVGEDKFWANSEEIRNFLSCQENETMLYRLIDDDLARTNREMKDGLKINGCMKNQLFVFKPNQKPLVKQFFCDCEKCLNFEFHICERDEGNTSEYVVEKEVENVENNVESWSTENCLLDDVEDQYSYVYDFITEDSFINVLTYDQNHDLFYVIRVIGSKVAIDNITDDFKHVVLTNERYIEGRYLEVVK